MAWPASPPPSAAPTSDCAAIANESSSSALNSQSSSPIWWAATWAVPIRAATAAAVRNDAWKPASRSSSSLPTPSWARSTGHRGRHRRRSACAARRNRKPPIAWALTLATADPASPRPTG